MAEDDRGGEELTFSSEIMCTKFHPTSSVFLAGSISGQLHWVTVTEKDEEEKRGRMRIVKSMKAHKKSVRGMEFTNEQGDTIATVSKDKTIKLRDTESGKISSRYDNAHEAPINCLCVVDSCVLASGDDDGCVKLWDYRQQKSLGEFHDCEDYISQLVAAKDRRTLLATSGEGTLTAYNVRKKKLFVQSELMDSDLTQCQIVKDGIKVMCSTMDGVLYFFNWKQYGNMSDRFPGHPGAIECLVKLDERLIVTGCEDGKIRSMELYPHRFLTVSGKEENGAVGRTSTMPIQTMAYSSPALELLVATGSNGQEHLQLIDTRPIRDEFKLLNSSVKKRAKKRRLSKKGQFFTNFDMQVGAPASNGEEEEQSDNEDSDSSEDSDSEEEEKPKKKKR